MADLGDSFFTSVGCMDGRVQKPIAEYGQNKLDAECPDTITEAGLVGQLVHEPTEELLASVRSKITISSEKHHSKGVVVHGHQECAGNPVGDEQHKQDVRDAAGVIRPMAPALRIIPVFVVKTESGWKVEEL
ncbi:MAG: carbonic anhydrase [Candidatus Levyibacteriota bacterium]|jgi:carbonic anhydrase